MVTTCYHQHQHIRILLPLIKLDNIWYLSMILPSFKSYCRKRWRYLCLVPNTACNKNHCLLLRTRTVLSMLHAKRIQRWARCAERKLRDFDGQTIDRKICCQRRAAASRWHQKWCQRRATARRRHQKWCQRRATARHVTVIFTMKRLKHRLESLW